MYSVTSSKSEARKSTVRRYLDVCLCVFHQINIRYCLILNKTINKIPYILKFYYFIFVPSPMTKTGKFLNIANQTPDTWKALTTEDYVSISGWYALSL